MLFSQRYFQLLRDKKIEVLINSDVRRKLRKRLLQFNSSIQIQRNPSDSWIDNSSTAEEAIRSVMIERGWDAVPGYDEGYQGYYDYHESFNYILDKEEGDIAFDAIEAFVCEVNEENFAECQKRINQILEVHEFPWRIADGAFFKLDPIMMGAQLSQQAHEALIAHQFRGAADEYAKARQEFCAGDTKDAVLYAAKSFESIMKSIVGSKQANADKLIKELIRSGYFDDLPEDVRVGFAEQVLKTLPFIRNKLVGHGQGAEIVTVPPIYAQLALQLSAVMHNFIIGKHLHSNISNRVERDGKETIDDIPF